jgi:hypothetical protein
LFYFSEKDESISKCIQRDPLGEQPIWSYFGSRLIDKITTVSNDIRGFKLTLLGLCICNEYLQKNSELLNAVQEDESNKQKKYMDVFSALVLSYEMIFIYSIIDGKHDTHGILGSSNGKNRYENEGNNTFINPFTPILVNQISLGYLGRYKTPLRSMNIIDNNLNVNIEILNNVEGLYPNYKILKEAFFSFFDKLKGKNFRWKYSNFKLKKELVEEIIGSNNKEIIDFWEDKLGVDSNLLLNKVYELTKELGSPEEIIKKALGDINDPILSNVLFVEEFLLALDRLFSMFFNYANIKNVEEVLKGEIEEHRNRYYKIKDIEIKDANEALKVRFNELKGCNPNLGDSEYIKSVYNYHIKVTKNKGGAPWVGIDEGDGSITKFNLEYNPKLSEEIGSTWYREYYINTLRELRRGIRGDLNEQ